MHNNHNWKIFILLIIISSASFSQGETLKNRLSGKFNLITVYNSDYKEAYELTVSQPLDHSNPESKFNQRVFIGFRDFNAPTLLVTEGYDIDYVFKPGYMNELAEDLNANLIVVEHRFYGKSVPENKNWHFLTIKEASEDYHFIKLLLDTLLTGKWISSGISKGGQAALAYKLRYPKDVVATIVYGTAVKDQTTVTSDTLLSALSKTPCGKKINELQSYMFRNKSKLLPHLVSFTSRKKIDFTPLNNESVFEYQLLELPFSYWQKGQLCSEIPDTNETGDELINYLIKIVPPSLFSIVTRAKHEPSFYMFYHELGYYEYNVKPFKNYLSLQNYSNKNFSPPIVSIEFDTTYQKSLQLYFQESPDENIFFIYGQNDPWALQTTVKKNVFTIENGSHKSRISNLTDNQRNDLYSKIRTAIK